jgi:hypothetical protein
LGIRILNAIQRQIGAEHLEFDAVWFKGKDTAPFPDKLGKMQGLGANIGTHFNHKHSRLDGIVEELRFKRGEFAIAIKRSAHILIADVVKHHAIAAMLQAQMRAWQCDAGQFFHHDNSLS